MDFLIGLFFMKKHVLGLSLVGAAALMLAACGEDKAVAAQATEAAPAATQEAAPAAGTAAVKADSPFEERVSYSIGASVGTYIATIQRDQGEFIGTLDQDLIIKGFVDALGSKTDLTEQEIADTLMALDQKVRTGLEQKAAAEAQQNLEAGQKFLADNAKAEGVQTTASGLQYKILAEGSGKTPTTTDTVRVRYKGTTIDGKVFDEQKDPIAFPLANIIPGWTEGLQLMKEGGKAMLYIPSDLAYGEMGAGDLIKPNSVLIFEIELVEVVAPVTEEEPAAAEAAPAAEATEATAQ